MTAYVINEFERRAYDVAETPVHIGRDASNEIVLREPAISRFNSEIGREGEDYLLRTTGAAPPIVNELPAENPQTLQDGDRVRVGSAVLTFTRQRLPIGVSVIERPRQDRARDDIGNRRDTIKNPILRMPLSDRPPGRFTRAKVLLLVAGVLLLLYVLGR